MKTENEWLLKYMVQEQVDHYLQLRSQGYALLKEAHEFLQEHIKKKPAG